MLVMTAAVRMRELHRRFAPWWSCSARDGALRRDLLAGARLVGCHDQVHWLTVVHGRMAGPDLEPMALLNALGLLWMLASGTMILLKGGVKRYTDRLAIQRGAGMAADPKDTTANDESVTRSSSANRTSEKGVAGGGNRQKLCAEELIRSFEAAQQKVVIFRTFMWGHRARRRPNQRATKNVSSPTKVL